MNTQFQWWEWIFAPLLLFVGRPERIAIGVIGWLAYAAGLSALRRRFVWQPLVTGAVWALFAGWEWYCLAQGHNIRVDLFLIYPVLIAITIYGAIGGIDFRTRQFSLRALMIAITIAAIGLGVVIWLFR